MTDLLPFTTHRVRLEPGVWTMEAGDGDDAEQALSTQVVVHESGGSLNGRTIVDLGCLEGGYTATFARLGARRATGIEIRPTNYARCALLQQRLGLDSLSFIQGDVKSVSADEMGQFDIVFAQGILYHLDDPCVTLERWASITREVMVLDTHVANMYSFAHNCSSELSTLEWNGHEYLGRQAFEYDPTLERAALDQLLWTSHGNPRSFWLTETALVKLLADVGFPYIAKVFVPAGYRCGLGCSWECRVLVVARKRLLGQR